MKIRTLGAAKMLLCLHILLKGRAGAVYDSLMEEEKTDFYEHIKVALRKGLSPDTEEDC